jgi:hypothetical protein
VCLTIQEAKGLEFDDVLLYNPFHDSAAEKVSPRLCLCYFTAITVIVSRAMMSVLYSICGVEFVSQFSEMTAAATCEANV